MTNSLNPAAGAEHPLLSPVLTAELSRLFSAGFSLIPLGGTDGKTPMVRFRDRKRFPLSTVVDRMAGGGSRTYGIRLDGLLVVDVDSDTEEARAYVRKNFGTSPARTRTRRGFHLYFRFEGAKPQVVRLPNVTIDFKAGPNEYVVGPQSERPDGGVYWPEGRLLSRDALPWFKERRQDVSEATTATSEKIVAVGSRNDALKRRAAELLPLAQNLDDLVEGLREYRDREFAEPDTLDDSQIRSIAEWYWGKRESGRWWGNGNATVVVKRATARRLRVGKHHVALSLLIFLTEMHGKDPKATFAVDPRALRREGHFRDGVNQLYAAIKVLVSLKCLELARAASGKRLYHEYCLGPGVQEEEEKKRAFSYIGTHNGDPKDHDVKAA